VAVVITGDAFVDIAAGDAVAGETCVALAAEAADLVDAGGMGATIMGVGQAFVHI